VELQGGKNWSKKFLGIDIPKMDNVAFWDNIEWETTTAPHTPTPICNEETDVGLDRFVLEIQADLCNVPVDISKW
jgi:hypothetical protein